MSTLNERARAALRWLNDATDPPPEGAESWRAPDRTADAISVAREFDRLGLPYSRRSYRGYPGAAGASRTLIALKNRGLADSDGGGCFVASRWWITTEGRQEALALEGKA